MCRIIILNNGKLYWCSLTILIIIILTNRNECEKIESKERAQLLGEHLNFWVSNPIPFPRNIIKYNGKSLFGEVWMTDHTGLNNSVGYEILIYLFKLLLIIFNLPTICERNPFFIPFFELVSFNFPVKCFSYDLQEEENEKLFTLKFRHETHLCEWNGKKKI